MSLTLNMVAGGSGGGISPNKATIHVTATLGSQIDISLSGSVVKTIPSSKAIPNSDGKTASYYYSTTITGTYTVTATLGSITHSKTVTVSAMNQYDVSVKILILYELGNEYTDTTGGFVSKKGIDNTGYSKGTMTKNAESITLYASSAKSVAAVTTNKITLTGYKTYYAQIDEVRGTADQGPRLWITSDANANTNIVNVQFNSSGIKSANLSNIASGYVSVRALASTGNTCGCTFSKLWLAD